MNNDLDIWKRLRRGVSKDPEAFRTVVNAYYPDVYRRLWYLSGDADTAADLTQETFLQAWKSIPTFMARGSVLGWLRTIALRVWWKKSKRKPPPDNPIPLELASLDPPLDDVLVDREMIADAVRRLPEIYRLAIILRYVDDLDVSEIAAVLKIPAGTVKSRLSEATRRLRLMLVSEGAGV